ncbi:hypothetical protein KDX00_03815 [Cobetia amphilecti]|nr:hypothetical protein KDX00_03815 [Cobetia litoralis]
MEASDLLTLSLTIVGWLLLLIFHNSNLKRAEIARKKDKIIIDIEDLSTWVCNEYIHNTFPPELKETIFSSKITHIERRANVLLSNNKEKDYEDINSAIVAIREIDVAENSSEASIKTIQANLIEACDDFIDVIENYYENSCVSKESKSLLSIIRQNYDVLGGAAFAIFILVVIYDFLFDVY